WAAVLTAPGEGGALARRALPAVVAVPLVLGWVRLWGQRSGYYGSEIGVALLVISHILAFTVLLVVAAREVERHHTELVRTKGEIESRVEERTAALADSEARLRESEERLASYAGRLE